MNQSSEFQKEDAEKGFQMVLIALVVGAFIVYFYNLGKENGERGSSAEQYGRCMQYAKNAQERSYCVDYKTAAYYECLDIANEQTCSNWLK